MMRRHLRIAIGYAPYALASLVVLGPVLGPGFVLSVDMVFTPVLRMPDHIDNTFLFYMLLHGLNVVVPADLIQKILLLLALLLSGVGMHRWLLRLHTDGSFWRWAVYAGGLLYMINPFVYDRLMAGQYGVLLGYALLPWVARAVWDVVSELSWRRCVWLLAWMTVLSIVSIHMIGMALMVIVMVLVRRSPARPVATRRLALVAAAWLILSSYWLVPTLFGQGRIASSLATFGHSQSAFATVDANGTTVLGAVLGLQGFWQETRSLFILPIDAVSGWAFVYLGYLVLVAAGMWWAWRRDRRLMLGMGVILLVGTVLGSGVVQDVLGRLPLMAGYREPQKFVALVAFAEIYFIAVAVSRLMQKAGRWRSWAAYAVLIIGMLLPFAYTPTMIWGMYGQLRPIRYPADWAATNEYLRSQPQGKVLFLPWHLYMHYGFAGRIIASPAKAFFDQPIIVSDNPELPGVPPQVADSQGEEIEHQILPRAARGEDIGRLLSARGIRYILLAKEDDYEMYAYLDRQSSLKLVRDSETIRLYKLRSQP